MVNMSLLQALNAALLLSGLVAAKPLVRQSSFDPSTATLSDFSEYALSVAKGRLVSNSTCTADKVSVRKSWHNLTTDERIAYTTAVRCLQSKQAKTPSSLAAGAKTRYDDWVATHINQTLTIHFTGNFLGWHRWFVWEHEQALRNECGYTGSLPYWDWTVTAETGLAASPLFDGSPSSMSGDGLSLNYTAADTVVAKTTTLNETVYLPAGSGGGCVTTGPFANYTVNMGPAGLTVVDEPDAVDWAYPFQYNPRCLTRSLTDYANQRYANATSVLNLVREPPTVIEFLRLIDGDLSLPEVGVHGGGHWSLGGDPGRDQFVSPGDPMFFLHHGNIDRVWWLWQMQDPASRIEDPSEAIMGPYTLQNKFEPHRNVTADDVYSLGWVADGKTHKLGELLDPTAEDFCYVYE